MQTKWKKISIILTLLFLGVLVAFLPTLVSASRLGDDPLPTPVAPEPYPNTDIYPAVVYLATEAQLAILYQLEIEFEGLEPADGSRRPSGSAFEPVIATVYIDPGESDALVQAGLTPIPIPNEGYRSFLAYGPGNGSPDAWPTFPQYEARMQALESAHPTIVDMVSIGQSVQGRNLWCMQVTDHPGLDENEPEFKYTANHHGDETTGVEMVMRLAELLANSYGTDPVLTDMVDQMEIWLCPIYNPDGYTNGTRYNAHGVDLNRDFPDRVTEPVDDPTGREPETQYFMQFGYAHRFSMGANYHGGAQVLNYPWDSVYGSELAPDDQLFWDFGYGYTSRNSDLWNGGWPYGMTRGWEWYIIRGGMQDWAYFWRDEHHVTLEISDNKKPPFEQMDGYWDRNRDAMIWWMQRSMTGLAGQVLDARNGDPLDGTVTLVGWSIPPLNNVLTDPGAGDYHRVISPGTYTLNASATGYQSQSATAIVLADTLTSRDFNLCPTATWIVSGIITDASSGQPLEATIEFLGSPQATSSDPATGEYSIEICPGSYTMKVSAAWHYAQERPVLIDHSQIQDFALLSTSNLTASNKESNATQPLPLETVQYQLHVVNHGSPVTVTVTDTLPISMTWTGELTATQGIPIFEGGQILWQGEVAASEPVTITYSTTVNQCLAAGLSIMNLAEFTDGQTGIVTGIVELQVANAEPSLPSSPSPADGASELPISTALSWAASSDLNCDPLTYSLALGTSSTPPIVVEGLVEPNYAPQGLLPGTTYYWYVIVDDGVTQTSGPTWSFSTAAEEELILRTFLPMTVK